MKYQIIHIETGRVVAEAKRINDSFLVHEVRKIDDHGYFKSGECKLFKDNEEIDPMFVLDKDEERYNNWLKKKKETHKLVYINTGVCSFKQNRKKVWVRK